MIRFLVLAIALFLALPASAAPVWRVGTEPNFPPMSFVSHGRIIGFEIDLINAIAKSQGVTVVLKHVPFSEQAGQLASGALDLAISSWTITPERLKTMRFSDSYFDAGQAVIVSKASKVRTRAQLAPLVVGVQRDTTGEEAAKAQLRYKRLEIYADVLKGVEALDRGSIGAVVIDLPVALDVVKTHPKLKIIGVTITQEQYGIAISPSKGALIQAINRELARMKSDGRYSRLFGKWFAL